MEIHSHSDTATFFKMWFHHLHILRRDLRSVRNAKSEEKVKSHVDGIIAHYEMYYRVRNETCRSDPVWGFTTPWATCIERSIVFWLAGWRPNILIHLLYTESSRHFEQQLQDLLNGLGSGDLGDLSPSQLNMIDELQRRTIREEEALETEISRIHEEMASRFHESKLGLADITGQIKYMIDRADDLRMRTLRTAVGLLRPMQAIDLLIALADFEIGLRKFGEKQEKDKKLEDC